MPQAVTQNLPVGLTDDEVRQKHERIVALLDEQDVAIMEFKGQGEAHKRRLSLVATELATLKQQARSRTEVREVEVEEIKRYEPRFVVETVRVDTGEVIATRGMTVHERQRSLELSLPIAAPLSFAKPAAATIEFSHAEASKAVADGLSKARKARPAEFDPEFDGQPEAAAKAPEDAEVGDVVDLD